MIQNPLVDKDGAVGCRCWRSKPLTPFEYMELAMIINCKLKLVMNPTGNVHGVTTRILLS